MSSEKITSFLTRSASALLLAPLVLYILYTGTPYVQFLLLGLFCLCMWEWARLCWHASSSWTAGKRIGLCVLGIGYGALAFGALAGVGKSAPRTLMGIFLMVWTSDVGAYLVGNVFKGPKLCPAISPNKTWSGFLGGFFLTLLMGYLLISLGRWSLFGSSSLAPSMFFVLLIATASPLGDLLESWIKRRFQVKDTGALIPGHGGVLDRLDSLMAVGFVLFFLSLFF